jgi:microsomal dipeptidase-like Zn-dependent dipeptidase
VKKMNSLGVAVDLSHANAQTTVDAIAASSKPTIMSMRAALRYTRIRETRPTISCARWQIEVE